VNDLLSAVGAAIGSPVRQVGDASGGSISSVLRVVADDGRDLVVKHHPAPAPGMFTSEERGLAWIGAAPGGPRVPRVDAARDEAPAFIAMEYIEVGPTTGDGDEALGRSIAALHRAGAGRFGLDRDNVLATIAQDNTAEATWAEFLGTRRLAPWTRLAVDAGQMPDDLARDMDRLIERLPELVGPDEPPARLHGDLWSSNVMRDAAGGPVVIDPAVYGGHREIDLAMMRLFGGFRPRVFEAYEDAHPLADGWSDRITLHQVPPLLAHVILFGGGYVGQLRAAVRRYL